MAQKGLTNYKDVLARAVPPWGVKSTHLHRSAGRHLPRAVMPKYLKDKTQISAMMLKFPYKQPQQGMRPTFRTGP